MKIQSSDILMTSQHFAVQEQTKTESLKVWVGTQRPDFEKGGRLLQLPTPDRVDLSQQARSADHAQRGNARSIKSRQGEDEATDTDSVSRFISILMELITGRKITLKTIQPSGDSVDPQAAADLSQAARQAAALSRPQSQPAQQPSAPVGFGLEYDSRETSLEAETMHFSAQGVVKTSDGKQIDFHLELLMQRVLVSEQSTSIRLGDAVVQQQDPLVINFGGTAAQLTDTKFSFDINSDGNAEQLSFVGPNSGFIALDRNNDGIINNGSELFGTVSGNGLQDLAAYDQDTNGWIDEHDSVFSQLQVWAKDAQGVDSLQGLQVSGVGALYLGSVSTLFDFKTSGNESLGTLRTSGVYLKENGEVATLQDIDLTL